MGSPTPVFTPKNAVLGVVRAVPDVECLVETEDTGSSPVSSS